MSPTWTSEAPPPQGRIGMAGWALVALRGGVIAVLCFGGLAFLLALRLIERPIWGARRPLTPWITQFVCRNALRVIGIRYRVEGRPMKVGGAVVANHSSWLDIFVLNARKRIYFVSKAEVARWPGIGWLARATGTVFITRAARDAARQREVFAERLKAGHRLLFFPEGTSTDGQRVLPFKPTLFAAVADQPGARVQPVSVLYLAPRGADARFYGWWGDMAFGPHLAQVLGSARQGAVRVIYHPPLAVADFPDRKALARAAEEAVRAPFAAETA